MSLGLSLVFSFVFVFSMAACSSQIGKPDSKVQAQSMASRTDERQPPKQVGAPAQKWEIEWAPTPQTPGQKIMETPGNGSSQGWREEWRNALAHGIKEGKVVVLSSGTVTGARTELTQAFKDKYGITLEWISGPSSQVDQKIRTEQAAGLFISDLYFGGSSSTLSLLNGKVLDPVNRLLLLPEVKDPGIWYGGKLPFFDPDETAFPCLAGAAAPVFINTDIVDPGEMKSYNDLLKPKWKGKIVMQDPTRGGSGQALALVLGAKIMGWDYLREVAKQMPVVTNDARQQTEWVARGKYPIGWGATWTVIGEFTAAGAPLKSMNMAEGTYITASGGIIHLLKKAPHPNAARVFFNWVLTKEAQEIVQKGSNYPSRRLDVSKADMDPMRVPQPGQKLIDKDSYEFMMDFETNASRVKEIFLPVVGR